MGTDRAVKTAFNEQFARIGKGLSSPRRLELLDLLAQGERSVDDLAAESQMSVPLTSAHLQSLRSARLVDTRRDGSHIFYRLGGDDVFCLLASLRDVARERLADVELMIQTHVTARDRLEPVSREDLLARIRARTVTVIDVRPRNEYAAGHIPGARSMPVDELKARLAELPHDTEVVAYCRGPFCLYAPTAVESLRRLGFRAQRLEDGFPEWRLAGLPVATGLAQQVTI